MMKWKVVRSQSRSQSADRSLECLKKIENNNNNNSDESGGLHPNGGDKENKAPAKESNRQRASSLVRKTAVLTTECINLRSILGLARQRSETNLSSVGLVPPAHPPQPARRSRSEARLADGQGLTRSSSPPPAKGGGWLRGRKRERESRKSEEDPGKTVVTGSQRKKRTGGGAKAECRTDSSSSGKACTRKSKGRRKEEDIIEEEDVYVEIGRKEECPRPRRAGRKNKGQAPRPTDSPSRRRSSRKGRPAQTTPRPADDFPPPPTNTVVAEVHEELLYLSMDPLPVHSEPPSVSEGGPAEGAAEEEGGGEEELPFHIDTPDYSTLESTPFDASGEGEDRLDLIDQYRKQKAAEGDSTGEDFSDISEGKACEEEASVGAVVSSSSGGEDSPTPFVVKKSFVLTIAKQEKGFQSLCANKKPDPPPAPPAEQISVVFRCADCPLAEESRKRSTSVPTVARNLPEGASAIRGRSRDRKSKERGKKGKGRKKESGFVMPQAVIDELSQVLEKRKPSLDEVPAFLRPPTTTSS